MTDFNHGHVPVSGVSTAGQTGDDIVGTGRAAEHYEQGRDDEQDRIVAWLRSRGRVTARIGGDSQTLVLAADAIERGEHR